MQTSIAVAQGLISRDWWALEPMLSSCGAQALVPVALEIFPDQVEPMSSALVDGSIHCATRKVLGLNFKYVKVYLTLPGFNMIPLLSTGIVSLAP